MPGHQAHRHQGIDQRRRPQRCRARRQRDVLRNIKQILQGSNAIALLPGTDAFIHINPQLDHAGNQEHLAQHRHKPQGNGQQAQPQIEEAGLAFQTGFGVFILCGHHQDPGIVLDLRQLQAPGHDKWIFPLQQMQAFGHQCRFIDDGRAAQQQRVPGHVLYIGTPHKLGAMAQGHTLKKIVGKIAALEPLPQCRLQQLERLELVKCPVRAVRQIQYAWLHLSRRFAFGPEDHDPGHFERHDLQGAVDHRQTRRDCSRRSQQVDQKGVIGRADLHLHHGHVQGRGKFVALVLAECNIDLVGSGVAVFRSQVVINRLKHAAQVPLVLRAQIQVPADRGKGPGLERGMLHICLATHLIQATARIKTVFGGFCTLEILQGRLQQAVPGDAGHQIQLQ